MTRTQGIKGDKTWQPRRWGRETLTSRITPGGVRRGSRDTGCNRTLVTFEVPKYSEHDVQETLEK